MNELTTKKLLRKAIIWAEIKANEQEYGRLCKQIHELEEAKKDISFQVQRRLNESQDIAEWIDEQEYYDRFSNDNEDSRREQDEEDRAGESGKYDAHYGME